MSSISIELRGLTSLVAKLGRLPLASRDRLRVFMARFTLQLRDQVKANIADRFQSKGPLYQGVQSEIEESTDEVSGRVFINDVPYAAIQEYGGTTPPHVIVPKNAQALAFLTRGGGFSSGGGGSTLVFAKRVNHPGSRIPERSYARLALVQTRGAFETGIRAVTAEAVQEAFSLAAE